MISSAMTSGAAAPTRRDGAHPQGPVGLQAAGPARVLLAERAGAVAAQHAAGDQVVQTKARGPDARPTFPALQNGAKVARNTVPNFHSFRHSAASEAIAAGDSAEEVSWQLGHRNSQVTRTVYLQEIASAERRARPRASMEARYGAMLEAPLEAPSKRQAAADGGSPAAGEAEIVALERKRRKAQ
jgi:hypothetical protein